VESLRDLRRSRAHATRAFELGNEDYDVLSRLVDIHNANGDIDEALQTLERAVAVIGDTRRDPKRVKTLESLKKKEKALKEQATAAAAAADRE
jgi:hypothetical protein